MKSVKVAVALAHGHTAKWLQTVIHSLKNVPAYIDFDIYVATTWPKHASIKAITENDLGDNVTLIEPTRRLYSHAVGLDEILEHIWDKGYNYMFCTETDCRAVKEGWLAWFVKHIQPGNGMAGFFWAEGNNHYNINPSATIYDMRMLKKFHEEARNNNEGMFYHPKGNVSDADPSMDDNIKDVVGAFSETRGIKNPTFLQELAIKRGVPNPAWWEPGQWIYARAQGEWSCVVVPCDHIYMTIKGKIGEHTAPEATYYGGKLDPYFIHYWGGTRAWDHLKHPVEDQFVKNCSPYWLDREDFVWRETVPVKYHQIVYDIYDELGLEGMGYNKA
jgi:hypothetical protein